MLGYWLGNNFSQTGGEEDLTELVEIGSVPQMMSKKFSLHLYESDTFMDNGEPGYRGGEEEKSSRILGHETSKIVE